MEPDCTWGDITELDAGRQVAVVVPPREKELRGTIQFLRQTPETPVLKVLLVGRDRHILRDSCEVNFIPEWETP